MWQELQSAKYVDLPNGADGSQRIECQKLQTQTNNNQQERKIISNKKGNTTKNRIALLYFSNQLTYLDGFVGGFGVCCGLAMASRIEVSASIFFIL